MTEYRQLSQQRSQQNVCNVHTIISVQLVADGVSRQVKTKSIYTTLTLI